MPCHSAQEETCGRIKFKRDLTTQRARLAQALPGLTQTEKFSASLKAQIHRNRCNRHARPHTKPGHESRDNDRTKSD